jgi:hypothetical protein
MRACTISDRQFEELERSGALCSKTHSALSADEYMDSDSGSQEYGDNSYAFYNNPAGDATGPQFYLTDRYHDSNYPTEIHYQH